MSLLRSFFLSSPAAFSPSELFETGIVDGFPSDVGGILPDLGNPSPPPSVLPPGKGSPQKSSTTLHKRGYIAGHIGEQEHRGCLSGSDISRREPRPLEAEGTSGLPSGSSRKRRWIKSKGKGKTYTLGSDVEMVEVLRMSAQTLVGKAYGRSFAIRTVVSWVDVNWKSHLGYAPKVVALARNWFAFHFQEDCHAKWALTSRWSWDHNPVVLKTWSPMFDASRERIDTIPLWVKLPNLSLHF